MTVSAKLYSCWNKVPSTSGKANRKIWNSGLPTVRSVVPDFFFSIVAIAEKLLIYFVFLFSYCITISDGS